MKRKYIIFCLFVTTKVVASSGGLASIPATLSLQQQLDLSQRIELNETAGKDKYLTYWSKNEPFPSFGIGHFIWLPNNINMPFKETFPRLVAFLATKTPPPIWLANLSPFKLPWQNKQQFDKDLNKLRLKQLRRWLKKTKKIQAEFIYQRFISELNLAKQSLSNAKLNKLEVNLTQLIKTPAGFFAIIDYANFKGIGNNQLEVYNYDKKTIRWGLIDVVLAMPSSTLSLLENFIKTAKFILHERTKYAPKQNEKKWLKGWYYRLDGYRR